MKLSASLVSFALLAISASASPTPGQGKNHDDRKWYNVGKWKGGDKWDDSGKWYDGGKQRRFTSTFSVKATPDQVVNGTEPTGGLPGCVGYYDFGINRKKNVICYDIRIYGFKGEYESPAITATHMHEGPKGQTGPPRLAFPDPKKTGKGDERRSKGCLQGPFRTGVEDEETGLDTGVGWKVSEIEKNPEAHYADVHSSLAVPGAHRGQLDD